MMPLLYVSQFTLVAVALALIGFTTSERFGLSRLTSACLAVTLTPHVLATSVLLIALLWPGAPSIVFLSVPGAIALMSPLLQRQRLKHLLIESVSFLRASWIASPWTMTAVAGCALFLLGRISFAVDAPLIGHDALIYLNEAKTFAQHRTISSIPGFEAELGEVVKTHPHLFFWPAYLAQALMATDGGLGYPNDVVARGAILITLPLMVAGVVALAFVAGANKSAWIALPLVLLIKQLGYIPVAGSVDAFRTIPFLAAIAMVMGLIGRKDVMTPPAMAALGFLVAVCAAAHTINLIYIFLLLGCVWLFVLPGGITWQNALLSSLAAAIFLIPNGIYFAINYRDYGRPLGLGFDYYFYPGTPIWESFSKQLSWTTSGPFFEAVSQFSQIHGPIIVSAGILFSTILLGRNAFKWEFDRQSAIATIFLVLLFIPLINVGSGVTLQGAMLSNQRYGLMLMCLAPVIISNGLHNIYEIILNKYYLYNTKIVWCILFIIITLLGVDKVNNWNIYEKDETINYLNANELLLVKLSDTLPADANWTIDRYTPAYFSDRVPIKLASVLGHPMVTAKTTSEAADALERLDVRMVAINNWEWWERTALGELLLLNPEFEVASDSRWRIFILPEGANWRETSVE